MPYTQESVRSTLNNWMYYGQKYSFGSLVICCHFSFPWSCVPAGFAVQPPDERHRTYHEGRLWFHDTFQQVLPMSSQIFGCYKIILVRCPTGATKNLVLLTYGMMRYYHKFGAQGGATLLPRQFYSRPRSSKTSTCATLRNSIMFQHRYFEKSHLNILFDIYIYEHNNIWISCNMNIYEVSSILMSHAIQGSGIFTYIYTIKINHSSRTIPMDPLGVTLTCWFHVAVGSVGISAPQGAPDFFFWKHVQKWRYVWKDVQWNWRQSHLTSFLNLWILMIIYTCDLYWY